MCCDREKRTLVELLQQMTGEGHQEFELKAGLG